MGGMSVRHPRHSADAVRITTAPQTRAEEIASRQRRYLYSMALRTLCVIGAVVVGDGVLRWVLIAGAVFLPYVAVVMANAVSSRDDDFTLADVDPDRPELQNPRND
jgi:hypothetical protein